MDLSILIVTYNSAPLMDRLLRHLAQEIQGLSAQVIVLDNASKDDTVQTVRSAHPWVQVIASAQNLGFAAGNNLAAHSATGRYLLLLNPDALPAPGALAQGLARYDEASTLYAEFGPFYTGLVGSVDDVLNAAVA